MAAAFVALNEVFGPLFEVGAAEAAEPEAAAERAQAMSRQFIIDDQVHFVRDDFKEEGLLDLAKYAAQNWNPDMTKDARMDLARYKFNNFVKEVYIDSDTKIALLSGAPFDDKNWWLLTNDQIEKARRMVNGIAGTQAAAVARGVHAEAAGLDGRGRPLRSTPSSRTAGRATRSAIR